MKYLILLYAAVSLSAYEHTLSVATIFRDDADILMEWIEYHKIVGVQHFRLYNHFSEDNFAEILLPYIEEGIVELIDWKVNEHPASQLEAYEDAINALSGKSKWVAMIDTDEFILPMECDSLVEFLKDYEKFAAVAINWQLFGTSDLERVEPDELYTEVLTYKFPRMYNNPAWQTNKFVKCIIQPEKIKPSCFSSHMFTPKKRKFEVVDPNKRRLNSELITNDRVPVTKICINHYWFRSKEWFYKRKLFRRLPNRQLNYTPELIEEIFHDGNLVKDLKIQRFVPQLKEKMAYRGL